MGLLPRQRVATAFPLEEVLEFVAQPDRQRDCRYGPRRWVLACVAEQREADTSRRILAQPVEEASEADGTGRLRPGSRLASGQCVYVDRGAVPLGLAGRKVSDWLAIPPV
jgi:hypothetical protein